MWLQHVCLGNRFACKQASVTFILRHCVLFVSGTLEKWPRMYGIVKIIFTLPPNFLLVLPQSNYIGTYQAKNPAHCMRMMFFTILTRYVKFSDYFTLYYIIWKRLLPLKVTVLTRITWNCFFRVNVILPGKSTETCIRHSYFTSKENISV